MSKVVDERIVRMEFDNAKFERNVGTSLSTIERLKKALNFDDQTRSVRELQKQANKITFDDMASSLSKLEKRFSTTGIVGMTVIQDLTRSAEQLTKKLLSVFTEPFAQAKNGGWSRAMNIKDAEFSMKGLGILGEKLTNIKDDINYAVSGTAFGYDAAAKAAAQYAASNVKIGNDMKSALRSVSGVAAQTNTSYEEIAGIFTTVAANGKLMTQQLRQLSFRGLNASATLAQAMGKSEAEINDMVSKGEISFKQFSEAMDSAFGEHATAANETFTGALNNMKAALSRIGANFADPLIDAERDVFNQLRDFFNSLNSSVLTEAGQAAQDKINELLGSDDIVNVDDVRQLNREIAKRSTYVTELGKAYTKERNALLALKDPTEEQKRQIKELGKAIEAETVHGSGAFMRMANVFKANLHNLRTQIVGFLQLKEIKEAGNNIVDAVSEMGAAFSRIFSPIATAWRSIFPEKETTAILRATERFKKFFKELKISKDDAEDLTSAFRGLFSVLSILFKVAKMFFNVLVKVGEPVMKRLVKVAGWLGERLVDLEWRFDQLCAGVNYTIWYFKQLQKGTKKMTKPMSVILVVLATLVKVIGTVAGAIVGGLGMAFSSLVIIISAVANAIGKVFEFFAPIGNSVIKLGMAIGGALSKAFRAFSNAISSFTKRNKKVNQNANESISVFSLVIDVISKALGTFRDFVTNGINFLANAIDNLSFDNLQAIVTTVIETIGNFASNVGNIFGRGLQVAITIVTTAFDALRIVIGWLGDAFSGAASGVKEFFGSFNKNNKDLKETGETIEDTGEKTGGFLEKLKEFFEGMKDMELFEKIKGWIDGAAESLKNFAKSLTPAKMGAFVFLASIAVIVAVILTFIAALTNFTKTLTAVPEAVLGTINAVKTLVNTITAVMDPARSLSAAVREIAIAIAAIAFAVRIIGDLDPKDAKRATAVLLACTGMFLVMEGLQIVGAKLMKGVIQQQALKAMMSNMWQMAAAIGSMALILKVLATINWTEFIDTVPKVIVSMIGLSAIMAEAIMMSRYANPVAFKDAIGNAVLVAALSASLILITKALEELIGVPVGGMWRALLGMVPVLITLAGISWIISQIKFRQSAGLLLIVVALYGLIPYLKILADMDYGALEKGMEKYGGTILMIAGIAALVAFLTRGTGFVGCFNDFAKGLIAMAFAIGVLLVVTDYAGHLEKGPIKKGMAAILTFIGFFTLMEILSRFTVGNNMIQFSVGLLAMTASVGILVGLVYVISLLDKNAIEKGVMALSAMLAFVALLEICSKFTAGATSGAWKMVLATTLEIVAVAGVMWLLSDIPWEVLATTATVMAVAMIGMALAIGKTTAAINKIGIANAGASLLVLLPIIGVLIVLAYSLKVASTMDWAQIGAVGLTMVGTIFGIAELITSLGKEMQFPSLKTFLGMAAIIGIVGAIAYFLSQNMQLLKGVDWKVILSTGVAINGLFRTVSATFKGVQETNFGIGIRAAVELAAFIVTFALTMSLAQKLSEYLGFDLSAVIGDTFKTLGSVIASIIEPILDNLFGVIPRMKELANAITETFQEFQNFLGVVGEMKPNDLNTLGAFAKALLAFGAAEVMASVSNILGVFTGHKDMSKDVIRNMTAMGLAIRNFGIALRADGKSNKGLTDEDIEKVKKAAEAGKVIADMLDSLPNSGGLAGTIFGENNDYSGFAEGINVIGPAMIQFAEDTKDVKIEDVKKAAECMKLITGFASDIPNSGGMIGEFFGENDLGPFASGLILLGPALAEFNSAVNSKGELSKKAVSKAAICMDMIIAFSREVPNDGGFIQKVFGSKNLIKFGEQLPELGTYLSEFSGNVNFGVDGEQKAQSASIILKRLAEAAQLVANSAVFGRTTVTAFAKANYKAGGYMAKFVAKLQSAGSLTSTTNQFIKCIKALADLDEYVSKKVTGAIKNLAKDMKSVSNTGLNAVSDKAITNFQSSMDGVVTNIESRTKAITNAGTTAVNGLGTGIDNATDDVVGHMNKLITQVVKEVSKTKKNFKIMGETLAKQLAKGLNDLKSTNEVKNAGYKLVDKLFNSIDLYLEVNTGESKAYKYGRTFASGFAAGIDNDAYKSANAAWKMGRQAIEQLDKAIDDPMWKGLPISKESLNLGKAFGNGYAAGIEMLQKGVKKASELLAKAGIKGLDSKKLSGAASALGKIAGGDYVGGLLDAFSTVKRKDGISMLESLFNEIVPKDVATNLGTDFGDELGKGAQKGLKKATKTGGGPKSKTGAADKEKYKWSSKDVSESLTYLSMLFQQYDIAYDAFNKKYLKKGQITLSYIAHSIKDTVLANATMALGNDTLKGLEKQVDKEYDKMLKKYMKDNPRKFITNPKKKEIRAKAAKKVAKDAIATYTNEWKDLKRTLTEMTSKKVMKTITSIPSAVATYINAYDGSFKKFSTNINHLADTFGKGATNVVKGLGEYLYKKTDEYKENSKQLEKEAKKLDSIRKKAQKQQDIIDDPKKTAKQKQKAKARLKSYAEQAATIEKSIDGISKKIAQGPGKQLTELKKSIKSTVKEFLKLGGIDFGTIGKGLDKFEAATNLVTETSRSIDAFSSEATTATQTVTQAFDLLSASMETGINLMEKFIKTGTVEAEALQEYADGQLQAYEEFQNGIKELRKTNLNKAIIENLEEQGPEALNYIRGFLSMSSNEISKYNESVTKKNKYESDKLIQNMIKQADEYEAYVNTVNKLKISDELKKKLLEQGVSNKDFVTALTRMDQSQINKVVKMYAASIQQSVDETAATDPVDYMKLLNENAKSYDDWRAKLDKLSDKLGDGFSKALKEQIESNGYSSSELLDWLLKQEDSVLKEYNRKFEEYNGTTATSGGISKMIENVKSQITAMRNWYKILDKMRKEDALTYKEISEMGFETGYEYAEAWMNGDKESRKELEAAIKERNSLTFKNVANQMVDKKKVAKDWASNMDVLAKAIPKDMWEELYEMGVEGADTVQSIVNAYYAAARGDSSEARTSWNTFINEYNKNAKEASKIADSIAESYAKKMELSKTEAWDNGYDIGMSMSKGMIASAAAVSSALSFITDVATNKAKFNSKKGMARVTGMLEAVNTYKTTLSDLSTKGLISRATYNSLFNQAVGVGNQIIVGLNQGVLNSRQIASLETQVENLANVIINTVNRELKIKSPSRVMQEVGEYVVAGLARGIVNSSTVVKDATGSLSGTVIDGFNSAVDTINKYVHNEIEADPVIKPTLDLSKVTKGVRNLNRMMDATHASINVDEAKTNQNGSGNNNGGMTFIQNNYSPKALDRLELYRQTNNQFARAKGLVTA